MVAWQEWPTTTPALVVASLSTVCALSVSAVTVYKHLAHWTRPRTQGQIIRIVLICPIYAIASLISLATPDLRVAFYTEAPARARIATGCPLPLFFSLFLRFLCALFSHSHDRRHRCLP